MFKPLKINEFCDHSAPFLFCPAIKKAKGYCCGNSLNTEMDCWNGIFGEFLEIFFSIFAIVFGDLEDYC